MAVREYDWTLIPSSIKSFLAEPSEGGILPDRYGVIPGNVIDCGGFGCVLSTRDPGRVVKITQDRDEADGFFLLHRLRQDGFGIPGFVEVYDVRDEYRRESIYVIWREAVSPIAMELAGDSLAAWYLFDELNGATRHPEAYRWAATQITGQPGLEAIGAGLLALADHGIYIYDVKHGNIGRRDDGTLVVYDFSLGLSMERPIRIPPFEEVAMNPTGSGALRLVEGVSSGSGVYYKTGVPVVIPAARNTRPAPFLGSRFGQDIEPAGIYFIERDPLFVPAPGWTTADVAFARPLVIEWAGYGQDGWKRRLSERFWGLTGAALSAAILEDGFDGIVTASPYPEDIMVREIVSLVPVPGWSRRKRRRNPMTPKSVAAESKKAFGSVSKDPHVWLRVYRIGSGTAETRARMARMRGDALGARELEKDARDMQKRADLLEQWIRGKEKRSPGPRRIKIRFSEDRMGSVILTPVNERLRDRIIRHLADLGVESDGTVYVQDGDYVLFEHLSQGQIRDVREGWDVTVLMDPWIFLNYVGYDAAEGVVLP